MKLLTFRLHSVNPGSSKSCAYSGHGTFSVVGPGFSGRTGGKKHAQNSRRLLNLTPE